MSGLAGQSIGLDEQSPTPIGGPAALDAESKGSMENFIGFGAGATSYDPAPVDFDATDDTVTSAADGTTRVAPEYTDNQLTWVSGPTFDPIELFANGEQGMIWDYTDYSTLFQDDIGAAPVTAAGQPIGLVKDLSGNNNSCTQSVANKKPIKGTGALFNGSSDALATASIDWGSSTVISCFTGLIPSKPVETYGILDTYSSSLGATTPYIGFIGTTNEIEIAFGTPSIRTDPIQLSGFSVFDYVLDTAIADQALAIVVNKDGIPLNTNPHTPGQNSGQALSPLTLLSGSFGTSYYFNGEKLRQVVINRHLTEQEASDLRVWCANGRYKRVGGLTAELNSFQITGQSLAEGSKGAPITTTQEFDNVMFTLRENDPSEYVAAFTTTQDAETPMYGQIGYLKELVQAMGGAANYQMLGSNNGQGSASILILGPGSPTFDAAMSQVASAKDIADSQGRTYRFQAVSWVQGESDNTMSKDDYKSSLFNLSNNYNLIGKTSAGQDNDVAFITSQVSSNSLPNVALAQLEASEEDELITLSTPLYFFEYFSDGVHIVSESAKQLGGYMALAYKKVVVDGKKWVPVKPLSHSVSGNDVTITFNTPAPPLAFDTTIVAAQANYGFAAFEVDGTTPIAISQVALSGVDKVVITTATPVPIGGKITYALPPIGKGNLRDSQGNTVIYLGLPMHNWCVLFDMKV